MTRHAVWALVMILAAGCGGSTSDDAPPAPEAAAPAETAAPAPAEAPAPGTDGRCGRRQGRLRGLLLFLPRPGREGHNRDWGRTW